MVGLIPELSKVFTVVGLSIMWESGFNIIEKYIFEVTALVSSDLVTGLWPQRKC